MRFSLLVLYMVLTMGGAAVAIGQTFTRITEGSPVSDGGASRSVNWVDANNDDFPDLFVSNGLDGGENNLLYLNGGPDSSFRFIKQTTGPIVTDHTPSDGSSWADLDGDGDLDAFVVNWYGINNLLYLNNGDGTFEQVLGDIVASDGGYSESCTWGDVDNDGDVDLYVTNSGFPSSTGPLANALYLNNGDASFTKVSTGELVTDLYYSRGGSWIDYDEDGDLDMFVTNERNQSNALYRNLLSEEGELLFEQVLEGNPVTDVASSWSASWGDFDNDGDLDLFVANGWPYAQNDFLYENMGDGTFAPLSGTPVTSDGAFSACGSWGDYDNDGDLDLVVTTAYSGTPTLNFLYRNTLIETGEVGFEKVTEGDIVNVAGYSYGCAWEDYDGDGFLDFFAARTQDENQDNLLFRNDGINGNHWLEVRCEGVTSNRSGIGAKIRVKATVGGQPTWQYRVIAGQTGYCGQSLLVHFGLGDASIIDSLLVQWPSGTVDLLTDVPLDVLLHLQEGQTVSVDEPKSALPEGFRLYQNYPNPFNPSTIIRFELDRPMAVKLDIYDSIGQHVGTLVDGFLEPGTHKTDVVFDHSKSSGVYSYVLAGETFRQVRRLVFLK